MRRRSGVVVPSERWGDERRSDRLRPSGSPAKGHGASSIAENRESWLRADKLRYSISPSRRGDDEARERLALVKRGQTLGFGALVLTLATIVTLAAIGQPWVAGILATGLAAIVAIFVTGKYQAATMRNPEVASEDACPSAAELTS